MLLEGLGIGMGVRHIVGPLHYVDPSTGGVILQALLGGAAGVLLLLRLFWGRIKRLFLRKSKTVASGSSQAPTP